MLKPANVAFEFLRLKVQTDVRAIRPMCEQKMTSVRGVGHSQKQGIPFLWQRVWRQQELLIERAPVLAGFHTEEGCSRRFYSVDPGVSHKIGGDQLTIHTHKISFPSRRVKTLIL